MNRKPHRQKRVAILLVCALWVVAFSLACRLTTQQASAMGTKGQSLAQSLFGDACVALGAHLYQQADVYFHRGVPHEQARAFENDIFQRALDEVAPNQHVHLEGATDIREIMPWLDMATRFNPSEPEGYVVAAFWLANEAGRPELALNILDRGQRTIPYSYQVQLAKGRLFLHTGRHTPARSAIDAALAYWSTSADPEREEHMLDRAEALLYRSLLREIDGENVAAIGDLREMLTITPERPGLQKRLQMLERDQPTEPSARDLLESMLRDYAARRHQCEVEEQDHEHDEEHHHGDGHDHSNCPHCAAARKGNH